MKYKNDRNSLNWIPREPKMFSGVNYKQKLLKRFGDDIYYLFKFAEKEKIDIKYLYSCWYRENNTIEQILYDCYQSHFNFESKFREYKLSLILKL